jgi:hypothetical protein
MTEEIQLLETIRTERNPEPDSIPLLTHPTKSEYATDVVRKDIVLSTVKA